MRSRYIKIFRHKGGGEVEEILSITMHKGEDPKDSKCFETIIKEFGKSAGNIFWQETNFP